MRIACFAKDLATLQRLGPHCPICHEDVTVTIHDTDCQDDTVIDDSAVVDEQEHETGSFPTFQIEEDAFSPSKGLNIAASAATATTGNGTIKSGTGTFDLGGTNPLNRAIDSDEDLY